LIHQKGVRGVGCTDIIARLGIAGIVQGNKGVFGNGLSGRVFFCPGNYPVSKTGCRRFEPCHSCHSRIAMTQMRLSPFFPLLLFCLGPLPAQAETHWTNNPLNRWQATALLQTLNAEILASPSATTSLEHWCGEHHLAAAAKLVAEPVKDAAPKPITPEQRQRLGIGPDEPVAYRHVRLRCGDHVLSEADNWYVPSRLTPEMNSLLATSDEPFGRVVRPLQPYRRTFAAKLLWSPLDVPPGAARLDPPAAVFEHRAVLYTDANLPFSEVDEVYQRDVLDFPPDAADPER